MAWIGAVIGAAGSYMSAKENQKVAAKAAENRTTQRVPYGNEYIARIAPYILANQQKVFESRMKGYGLDPLDFGPIGSSLAGIGDDYSGVSMKLSGTLLPSSRYNVNSMFSGYRPEGRPKEYMKMDRGADQQLFRAGKDPYDTGGSGYQSPTSMNGEKPMYGTAGEAPTGRHALGNWDEYDRD